MQVSGIGPSGIEFLFVGRLNYWKGAHIAIDAFSLGILLEELRVLYTAAQAGIQALLPPLELQYTDYGRWQAEMLAGPEGERLWAYWQQQLAGELPTLPLPTDRPRPLVQTYQGASGKFLSFPFLDFS